MKRLSETELIAAIEQESAAFKTCYAWLEASMPALFFEQIEPPQLLLITHGLMGLKQSDFCVHIRLEYSAWTLCLESPKADLLILDHYRNDSITKYSAFSSQTAPPQAPPSTRLRVTQLLFTDTQKKRLAEEQMRPLLAEVTQSNSSLSEETIAPLIAHLNPLLTESLPANTWALALELLLQATQSDQCQYRALSPQDTATVEILFAWRNLPRCDLLYRLAQIGHRKQLKIHQIHACYSEGEQPLTLMHLRLQSLPGPWTKEDLPHLCKELVTLKAFEGLDAIEKTFVDTRLLSGVQGHFVKTAIYFIHQALAPADLYRYALPAIEEALCRHPELTVLLVQAFERKFHPQQAQIAVYEQIKTRFLSCVDGLDTGNAGEDEKRKHILKQGLYFVDYTLKTNYYQTQLSSFSFRLDPHYLETLPYDRTGKYDALPFAIFFIKGFYFTGFHIRFRDLSRGGLRTVFPQKPEQVNAERNNLFSECYLLAYTQNKKNKDIPEGGAKGVIFLEPYPHLDREERRVQQELEQAGHSVEDIQLHISSLRPQQQQEYLYQAQRSYIESLLALVNENSSEDIVDYYKQPEYLYLGPDENMHNVMIEWIAAFSVSHHYKPGRAFISSKPGAGINHKTFGVTSFGVNVCMEEALRFLGIDPTQESFTIKMTGGPDGDVAGNEMANLYRYYPKTAKLLASIDISGTLFDPQGVDLALMHSLFTQGKPLRFYPPDRLNEGGFLLDCLTTKKESSFAQKTLCYKKEGGELVEHWLSRDDTNALLRQNVHQVEADVFIPGGGRPKTLNAHNIHEFLNAEEKPTARIIIEGANLYLTPEARYILEQKGTLIIKDSSANKGGVICSSLEVLFSLILSEAEFIAHKEVIVSEILTIIRHRARMETALLLNTHRDTGAYLTNLSEGISEKINLYKDELLAYLQTITLSQDPQDNLIQCLLSYAPPLIRHQYADRLIVAVPDLHKKALIACHIASCLVYKKGLNWAPSLIDVLPLVIQDPTITGVL